jgi:hypothetical protein
MWNKDKKLVENEIRMYIMLLKVNYLFSKQTDKLKEIASNL